MSSLHEGLGISTIEAAFTGRPMILTNVQGLKDFGEVISSGIAYCDLTPESMANAITSADTYTYHLHLMQRFAPKH